MSKDDASVTLNVSKEIIDAHVRAAVAQVLAKDPTQLVRAVIDAALTEKDRNSYSGRTIWEDSVSKMIREVATATCREWLEEQRPVIAKAVRDRLGKDKQKVVDAVSTKFTDTLLCNFSVSLDFGDAR